MFVTVMHCTDECIGPLHSIAPIATEILFNRALPSKIMTWSALLVEFFAPFTIWFIGLPRKITLFAVTMLLIGMDMTMCMHTFEWYGILGWSLFLIQRQDDGDDSTLLSGEKQPGFSCWPVKQVISTSVFAFLIISASCMALPFHEIINVTPQWFGEVVLPFEMWNNHLREYVQPITYLTGTYQDVWTLYSGGYDGSTSKLSVDAVLRNGTSLNWRSPNWQDLGQWEHKRLYNYMAYYKHLPDCDYIEDTICEEQENFLRYLVKVGAFGDGDLEKEVLHMGLFLEIEYPPQPPENLGWWDPIKQPLIFERQEMLSWIKFREIDHTDEDEDYDYEDYEYDYDYHENADEDEEYSYHQRDGKYEL